jgi:putative oxidoreductase
MIQFSNDSISWTKEHFMSNGLKAESCGLAVLRIVVGVVFVMHGWQKIHVFHLAGVSGMLSHLGIPMPTVFGVILTAVEFLGGILLITGLATRIPSVLLAIDMLVALITVHMKHGFFAPAGIELPLTLLGAVICLALSGGGSFSRKGW